MFSKATSRSRVANFFSWIVLSLYLSIYNYFKIELYRLCKVMFDYSAFLRSSFKWLFSSYSSAWLLAYFLRRPYYFYRITASISSWYDEILWINLPFIEGTEILSCNCDYILLLASVKALNSPSSSPKLAFNALNSL